MHDAVPFELLAKMIERELELAGRGQVEELHQAVDVRERYMRTLPVPAPPAAQPAVARATALHNRLIIETERVRESLAHSLAAARCARRVASTYAPATLPRWSTSA